MPTKQELIAELAHAFICGEYAKRPEEDLQDWCTKLAGALEYAEDCPIRLEPVDVMQAYVVGSLTMLKAVEGDLGIYHDPRTNVTINI